jgi:hypothetical protein
MTNVTNLLFIDDVLLKNRLSYRGVKQLAKGLLIFSIKFKISCIHIFRFGIKKRKVLLLL